MQRAKINEVALGVLLLVVANSVPSTVLAYQRQDDYSQIYEVPENVLAGVCILLQD